MGLVVVILLVGIKKFFGGEFHLFKLSGRDALKATSGKIVFAVFDLYKVDFLFCLHDEIYLAGASTPVLGN